MKPLSLQKEKKKSIFDWFKNLQESKTQRELIN